MYVCMLVRVGSHPPSPILIHERFEQNNRDFGLPMSTLSAVKFYSSILSTLLYIYTYIYTHTHTTHNTQHTTHNTQHTTHNTHTYYIIIL